MPQQVVMGAMLTCSMGVAPSSLIVTPINRVNGESVPAANIMDHIPMTNIMSFGMCNSLANPQVAAATTAALGVLTPQPCIPVIPAPGLQGRQRLWWVVNLLSTIRAHVNARGLVRSQLTSRDSHRYKSPSKPMNEAVLPVECRMRMLDESIQ